MADIDSTDNKVGILGSEYGKISEIVNMYVQNILEYQLSIMPT